MTKEAALYAFFNSFGVPAYPDTEVPDTARLPYITYQVITDGYTGEAVYPTVYIWYRTASEAVPNAKARELYDAIGPAGCLIPCDGGGIEIYRASPWCRNISDPADPTIKGRYINIALKYLTI